MKTFEIEFDVKVAPDYVRRGKKIQIKAGDEQKAIERLHEIHRNKKVTVTGVQELIVGAETA